jgi:hypothetical protein
LGKSLIAAEIITTTRDTLNLYVNGDYIGSESPIRRWGFGQRFCVDLLPSFNVFAVNGSVATGKNAGFIATILLTYSDGTTDTLLTDSSWRVSHGSPAGFEQLSFDDTTWATATVIANYGAAVWPNNILIPADPPAITLTQAWWMWTDVGGTTFPAGSRAFRRTFMPAPGQIPMSANIVISADNAYTLYVNGVEIGTGANWRIAQHYVVNFGTPTSEIVLAVLATNSAASAAGVLVEMEVNMQPSGRVGCTAGTIVSTDATWKSTLDGIPAGFEQPDFDDSTWPAIKLEGEYPVAPWNTLTIAAASAPITI